MDEKFHLFSDGSCDLPPELTREKNITVVPFYVSFGDEPYQKEIKEIAGKYADVNKSQYYSLKLISIKPSVFLDGYWDACYKVFNDCGNEIEGPLLIAISGETGQIYSMEELIMNDSENQNVKISNETVNERKDKSGTQM